MLHLYLHVDCDEKIKPFLCHWDLGMYFFQGLPFIYPDKDSNTLVVIEMKLSERW